MSIPPATSTTEGQKTTTRILDAAEKLFAERGFAGTAVRDIASQVDLNPASLYNHFAGKQALYEAVLERTMKPILIFIEKSPVSWTPTKAEQTISLIMGHLADNPNLARLLYHESLAGGAHMQRLIGTQMRPLVVDGLAAIKEGPAEQLWTPEELPLLFAAFIHLIAGHFVLAPLLGSALDRDALSEESLALETTFLQKVARRLLIPDDHASPSSGEQPATDPESTPLASEGR